jgi:hypothetical protein
MDHLWQWRERDCGIYSYDFILIKNIANSIKNVKREANGPFAMYALSLSLSRGHCKMRAMSSFDISRKNRIFNLDWQNRKKASIKLVSFNRIFTHRNFKDGNRDGPRKGNPKKAGYKHGPRPGFDYINMLKWQKEATFMALTKDNIKRA